MKSFSRKIMRRITERLEGLYGDRLDQCIRRLDMIIGRYGIGIDIFGETEPPSEKDVYLITYGDMIREPGARPLATLKRFMDERTQGAINTVHILPFFPYSSDDGFSVIDYHQVDPELGTWGDIENLSASYEVMADIVLNHCSRKCSPFRECVMGTAPFRDYFITEDPGTDLSAVTRPRSTPLLTGVQMRDGLRHVWTTFSSDQMDLNFANPDVLFEFIDILFFYRSKGIRVIRMDAIAFIWKEIGTTCLHHPQCHQIVKLFRDLIDMAAPDMVLLTETNVPHRENVSYFGNGDEAHMVYQFSLPPLLLHALLTGNTDYLTDWAVGLEDPPPGCTFLNFTSSHDGIGVRPLQGLIPDAELDALVEQVKARGGRVSMKQNSDGSESPYELNITYLSALTETGEETPGDLSRARFLCSQTAALAFRGIPAVYFNSLVGGLNNHSGFGETGRARTLNRGKWEWDQLGGLLDDQESHHAKIYRAYLKLLKIRAARPAFHPFGAQRVFRLHPGILALERTAPDQSESVVCVSNFTKTTMQLNLTAKIPTMSNQTSWHDLIKGVERGGKSGKITLQPYETVWLVLGSG